MFVQFFFFAPSSFSFSVATLSITFFISPTWLLSCTTNFFRQWISKTISHRKTLKSESQKFRSALNLCAFRYQRLSPVAVTSCFCTTTKTLFAKMKQLIPKNNHSSWIRKKPKWILVKNILLTAAVPIRSNFLGRGKASINKQNKGMGKNIIIKCAHAMVYIYQFWTRESQIKEWLFICNVRLY